MQRFIKLVLAFLIPVAIGVVVVFMQQNDPRFAHNFIKGDCSGHGKWVHDRIYLNKAEN